MKIRLNAHLSNYKKNYKRFTAHPQTLGIFKQLFDIQLTYIILNHSSVQFNSLWCIHKDMPPSSSSNFRTFSSPQIETESTVTRRNLTDGHIHKILFAKMFIVGRYSYKMPPPKIKINKTHT